MISLALAILFAPTPAQPEPIEAAKLAASQDEKICRKFAETGSLVRKIKTCRTRAEWRRIEEGAQETGRSLQTLLSTERGN